MQHLSDILQRPANLDAQIVRTTGQSSAIIAVQENWKSLQDWLNQQELDQQKRIGLLCSDKWTALQGLGAILSIDSILVPMDQQAPTARNQKIIADAALNALLMDQPLYQQYRETLASFPGQVSREGDWVLFIFSERTPNSAALPPLAYLLYTSGSTGQPKGVMISHENALSFINWASNTFDFSPADVFASIAPFHFDLSVFDIYVSIKHGSKLLLVEPSSSKNPQLLASLLAEHQVSILYATPTLLRTLLNYGKLDRYDCSSLRYVFFAGEVFPITDLKRLKSLWPQATFVNFYGPTETNVCTYYTIPDTIGDRQQAFPIGQACLPGTTRILNKELLVSGPAVSPGYWNSVEKNKASFDYDSNGVCWYKTGDLVEMEGKDYLFIGRRDRMVKRRGYRIELDEIEVALRKHPQLEQVAVVANTLADHQVQIKAWYKSRDAATALSNFDLKNFCKQELPLYMLPDQFESIEAFPITSTQKIDYQALQPDLI